MEFLYITLASTFNFHHVSSNDRLTINVIRKSLCPPGDISQMAGTPGKKQFHYESLVVRATNSTSMTYCDDQV